MTPAQYSKRHYESTKLLVVQDGGARIQHATVEHLGDFLEKGDLLIVNRSGTLPSSFCGTIDRSGEKVEIRLASFQGASSGDLRRWRAVSFGDGTWRQPTENRSPAPRLQAGDEILLGDDLKAVIRSVNPKFYRLVEVEFHSDQLVQALYRHGKPIQYSYLKEELQVWDQQTLFSGPPISVEPPSAAFPLNWNIVFKLQKKGIRIASLLHGAGLSSTGDPELDQQFPLDEFYEIPQETVELIESTKEQGGRVIALGTTVTRALETAFQQPTAVVANARTTLRLGPSSQLRIVDGMLTGMHEIGTSHAELMRAFSSIDSKMLHAIDQETQDYRSHEYGDLTLLIRRIAPEKIHFLNCLF